MKKFVDILLKSLMFILFASSIIIALCYSGKSYAANNSTTVFVYPKGNVSANIINILKVNGYIIVTSPQNANYVINYGQINKPGKETTLLVVPNGNISSNILSVLQSNGYNVVVIPSQNAAEYPAATSPQPVVVPEPYPYQVPYPYRIRITPTLILIIWFPAF